MRSHLFPNISDTDLNGNPYPNGVPTTGSGTIWHLTDDPDAYSNKRWFQAWDKGPADTHYVETSGLALTLANEEIIVYANHEMDSAAGGPGNGGQTISFYEKGGKSSWSYSMVNNFDEITAGFFRTGSESLTFDSISGYFVGSGGFDPMSQELDYHLNIFSKGEAGPGLTNGGVAGAAGIPGANQFVGDVFTSVPGWAAYVAGTMVVEPGYYVASDGYQIHRVTYKLDTPVTLAANTSYFFSPYAAVPEASTLLLVLCSLPLGLIRRR